MNIGIICLHNFKSIQNLKEIQNIQENSKSQEYFQLDIITSVLSIWLQQSPLPSPIQQKGLKDFQVNFLFFFLYSEPCNSTKGYRLGKYEKGLLVKWNSRNMYIEGSLESCG